jgi:hypothetical protein
MGHCSGNATGARAYLFSGYAGGLGDVFVLALPSPILNQSNLVSGVNSKDKKEQTYTILMPFIAATTAPVVAFALANGLFLPIGGVMVDFSNSILANLLYSDNNLLIKGMPI